MQGYEKNRFSANILLFLRNDTNRAIVTNMEYEQEIVPKLSSGTIFNEQFLIQISRLRHYLTLNISETVRHTNIVTMEY